MNELIKKSTMTVKEVANILNVSERTIQRHIKDINPEKVVNGEKTLLNEDEVTLIKLKIEKSGRNDLDNVVGLPKTNLEKHLLIKQAMILQNEIIEDLEKENINLKKQIFEDKPKVEFFDQVTDSKDAVEMKNVADVLNIKNLGRNKLFAFLRQNKILTGNNVPYRQYIDCGYFRIIEQKFQDVFGEIHINFKTVVYQSGIAFIRKKLKEHNLIEGNDRE